MKELDLKTRQQHALNVLKIFADFCDAHGFSYSLEFGTLLGAVRHNGFIPWDDDIDVSMPRTDYEKLLKFGKIAEHILIDNYGDGKEHDTNFAKVYDNRTYAITVSGQKRCGIYIDIYPMDYIPQNNILLLIHKFRLYHYYAGTKFAEKPTRKAENIYRQIFYNILSPFFQKRGKEYYVKKLNKAAAAYKNGRYMSVLIEPDREKMRRISSDKYFRRIKHKFEESEFYICSDYKKRLSLEYGDYMKLPPIDERKGHFSYRFFSIN